MSVSSRRSSRKENGAQRWLGCENAGETKQGRDLTQAAEPEQEVERGVQKDGSLSRQLPLRLL